MLNDPDDEMEHLPIAKTDNYCAYDVEGIIVVDTATSRDVVGDRAEFEIYREKLYRENGERELQLLLDKVGGYFEEFYGG